MIDAQEKEMLSKGMRVLWIIWGAMLASLCIYLIVGHMIVDEIKIEGISPDIFSLLRNILFIVALVELAIIPVIRKFILRTPAKISQSSFGQQIPGTANHPALAKYSSAMIVSLALAESIAIYGLVLLFIGKDFQSLYLFTGISAAAMLVYRPKIDELEKLAIGLKGEKSGNSYTRKI